MVAEERALPDSPFRVYARDADGTFVPDTMWPDHAGGTGAVRVYGAVKDDAFFVVAVGVKDALTMEPRRKAEFEVIDPMTNAVLERKTLGARQRFELSGRELFVLRGRFR